MANSELPQLLSKKMASFSVFIFIFLYLANLSSASTYSSSSRRYSRQLGYGGGGGGGLGYIQPYHQRQQSTEANFFQTMMSLNFDITEVVAMYRNVTAVAETPGCPGHCRTPMALWVVQSFYPCYNMKKADCPKGLVCCMQDPSLSSRLITSANTLQDSRVKARPSLVQSLAASKQNGGIVDRPKEPEDESSNALVAPAPTNDPPTSTTLFDEEYFKNNFIQDEIPDDD